MSWLKNNPLAAMGVFLMLGLMGSSFILGNSFLDAKRYDNQSLSVTGSAQRPITSDLASWQCRFSRQSNSIPEAYKALKTDLQAVKQYLISQGIPEKDLVISQVDTSTLYANNRDGGSSNTIEGYRLSQSVKTESVDVDRITRVSQNVTELVEKNIAVESEAPQYLYTKLDSLKVSMLGKAMENAKQRAQQMAQSTGNSIGGVRSAQMGVFQITSKNSTEVSDYGISDTSSKDKLVTAVVNASFSLR